MPAMMTAAQPICARARRGFLTLLVGAICLLLFTAGPSPAAEVAAPTTTSSWSARVLAPVTARTEPRLGAKKRLVVQPTAPFGGGPTILLVMERRMVDEREWIRVLLPIRPNGITGWIPSDVVRFRENAMRIVVDQSERRTYVYRSGKLVLTTRNAVGKKETPTPNGRFAIAEKILVSPSGFLGPAVLVTTGYSPTLNEYAGGNGRFALHGTSLPQLLGTRASHGCVRHHNDSIVGISRLVAPGTPITIRS